MLDGWYCRTLANEQSSAQRDDQTDPNVDVNGDDSGSDDSFEQDVQQETINNPIDYKSQYRYLKRKFKFLIYENEFFQDALRINQRRLLKVSRDRAFLLDRLLQYEKPENTSSESDETESSEDEATKDAKKQKLEQNNSVGVPGSNRGRKKKCQTTPQASNKSKQNDSTAEKCLIESQVEEEAIRMPLTDIDNQMLSRQNTVPPTFPERSSETIPNEVFSNEQSFDSESNDHMMDGSSPTHVAAEECVPMEYSNN